MVINIDRLYIGEQEFIDYQERFGVKEAVVTDLIRYDEPELEYSMKKVPIGYFKDTREIFTLNMTNSRRILILGSTGAGKSTLQSSIVDRFIKAGGVVSIFDLKGEFINKHNPQKTKYANAIIKDKQTGDEYPKYFFPAEIPQGFPISVYRPAFLHQMFTRNKKLAKHEKLCQLSLSSINEADMHIFFQQLVERNPRYMELVDLLYNNIKKKKLSTWEQIQAFIEESTDFDKNAQRLLGRTLRIMEQNEILGDTYDQPNMVQDINDKKLNIMNLNGMLNLRNADSPALMYTNIMFRKIYNAKVKGIINRKIHNMIVISEVNKMCPKLGDNPAKREFLKLLDLVRSERISLMVDTQDWKRIPETVISQSDYVFIPYNVDMENLYELVRKILPQEYDNPHDFRPKLSYWIKRMKKYKDGRRDWLLLDRADKRKIFIQPVMPLSLLTEEGD